MLVLSRKPGEKIIIGDGIELTVVAVQGNRIRLGISAPETCRIRRSECAGEKSPKRGAGEIVVDVALLAGCGV